MRRKKLDYFGNNSAINIDDNSNVSALKPKIPWYEPENYETSDTYVQLFCEHYAGAVKITPYIAYTPYTNETGDIEHLIAGYIEIHISDGLRAFGVYTPPAVPSPINTTTIYGAFGYINYTCSFTTYNSEIKAKFANLLAANPGKSLSIGSYLLYNAMRVFKTTCDTYMKKHKKHIPKINVYILWSYSLENARRAHRKVGKRSACTFLDQWRSLADTSLYIDGSKSNDEASKFSPNHILYTYPPLAPGEPIYETLMGRGANLNVMKNGAVNALNDNSYKCPSGAKIMNYSKTHNAASEKPSGGIGGKTAGGTRRRVKRSTKSRCRTRRLQYE